MSGKRYRICVDTDLCQGHGVCAAVTPEIGEDHLALAQRAARYCPNGVIRIEAIED